MNATGGNFDRKIILGRMKDETGTPSPDVIQFAQDLAHIVAAARALDLGPTFEQAAQITLSVRDVEARIRAGTQQGIIMTRIAEGHGQ